MERPRFFNPFDNILQHGEKLPHWQQAGATYFVTFRLADSLPQAWVAEWREERDRWLASHSEPWDTQTDAEYHRTFSARIDEHLDEGSGSCVLKDAVIAEAVLETLMHFHGDRHFVHTLVIMPNHLHVMVTLHEESLLPEVLKGWKGVSSRRINQVQSSEGPVWQKNYFDRLVRNEEHFFRVAKYIRQNPAKARLKEADYLLWESDEVRTMLG